MAVGYWLDDRARKTRDFSSWIVASRMSVCLRFVKVDKVNALKVAKLAATSIRDLQP